MPWDERAYMKRWYAENRVEVVAKFREKRERLKAWKLACLLLNPETVNAWFLEHAERTAATKRIGRKNGKLKRRAVPGKMSRGLAKRLFASQRGKCAACRAPTPKGMHLDHIHPLAAGGSNNDENIQLLCPTCNISKRDKHPVEFMQSMGFLL